jgi:ubiquinone/menaquinone biosynthesis C-methylase UbiE
MTRYLERLLAGETPTADDWNQHLLAFHAAFEDTTSGPLSKLRTAGGETSYEFTARRIRELAPNATSILEVGCGDGALLAELSRRFGSATPLTGIDLSNDEVARARGKVPSAQLYRGDASVDDLGLERYDVAVAHLSLMGMARSRAALCSVRRALSACGILVLVVEEFSEDDSLVRIAGASLSSVRDRIPGLLAPIPEGEPVYTNVALSDLLYDCGFGQLSIEMLHVWARLPPPEAWGILERSYPIGLLTAELKAEIRAAFYKSVELRRSPNGLLHAKLPLRFVVARVQDASSAPGKKT